MAEQCSLSRNAATAEVPMAKAAVDQSYVRSSVFRWKGFAKSSEAAKCQSAIFQDPPKPPNWPDVFGEIERSRIRRGGSGRTYRSSDALIGPYRFAGGSSP